jgi:hypothetical protein
MLFHNCDVSIEMLSANTDSHKCNSSFLEHALVAIPGSYSVMVSSNTLIPRNGLSSSTVPQLQRPMPSKYDPPSSSFNNTRAEFEVFVIESFETADI